MYRPKLGGDVGWKSRAAWFCRQPNAGSALPGWLLCLCTNCSPGERGAGLLPSWHGVADVPALAALPFVMSTKSTSAEQEEKTGEARQRYNPL